MTTLERATRTEAIEDIPTAELLDVQLIFDEAIARLALISRNWEQASRKTLGLEPLSSAEPAAVAPEDLTPQAA